jgi:hypothetical protein
METWNSALHGKIEAVEFIVDNCDNSPDTPDSCGAMPLMDALRSGHIAVAEYLIAHHKVCSCSWVYFANYNDWIAEV